MAVDHDQLFKQLLRIFTIEFIWLFLPEVAQYIDPSSITLIETEMFTDLVTGERHRADIVIKARFKATEGTCAKGAYLIIHVEPQGKLQHRFPRRMFQYFSPLHLQHDLPVYPVALLTYDSPLRAAPDEYTVVFPDRQVLHFSYRVIQLNRLNWRDFLRHRNPVAAALMTKMRIAKADRPRVKLECLRLLLTLKLDAARMTLIRGFMDAYLRLNATEIAQYNREVETIEPEERKAVMQIVNQWEEIGEKRGVAIGKARGVAIGKARGEAIGKARGVAIGEARGKRLGQIELLTGLLESRLGRLPANIRKKLSALETADLKSLTLDAASLENVASLRRWLDGLRR